MSKDYRKIAEDLVVLESEYDFEYFSPKDIIDEVRRIEEQLRRGEINNIMQDLMLEINEYDGDPHAGEAKRLLKEITGIEVVTCTL